MRVPLHNDIAFPLTEKPVSIQSEISKFVKLHSVIFIDNKVDKRLKICYNGDMGYDIRFREKVLNYIGKGHTIKEAHEVFEVGITTIKEWRKLKKETGKLEKRPLNRKHKKIDPDRLKTYIAENPDRYLREIAEEFNCTDMAVYYALKRLKITRKKNDTFHGTK